MYLRPAPRRNKDGSEVGYLQLARNVWDPYLRRSKVQVIDNFGREDHANREALQRLVANRALAPSSKLAAARWVTGDVLITGLPAASDDACYRAVGWLLEIKEELERTIFDRLANLLNLEADLLFFDTASTYFVTEEADEPVPRDKDGNAVTSGNTDSDEGDAGEPGSGPGGSPRITATTCPRSSPGWPSPGTGSRPASGAGPGTRTTPR
jgi:hypothetical protein